MEQQQIKDTVGGLNQMLANRFNGLQPQLVSGENIKTINGESLLSNGNIETGNMFSPHAKTVLILTQTEYDAISTKSDTTLYMIKEE